MNQIKFTTTSQKAYELEANVTGMNMAQKSTKFFLNLEKQRGSQSIIKLVIDDKEKHIFQNTSENFTKLFKTREQKTKIEMEKFFSDVDISKLSENQVKLCEEN